MAPDLRKRLLAILAADAAGYSRLMGIDDQSTVSALDSARSAFRHQVGAHGGRVVDTAGDSVLAVFGTAAGAMSAALSVQRALAASVAEVAPDRRLLFRIGLHIGDVIEKVDGSVYGDGVNVAARLSALAEPGGVVVSQAVHGMVARSADAVFEDLGEQRVKNIAESIRAFRAQGRRAAEGAPAASGGSPAVGRQAPGNLPEVASTLIAREADLAAVTQLVRLHSLVTLVGAGGIGKTRLGLALAHALHDEFGDGAWLVELAPVADGTLLPSAVAQAMGILLTGRKQAHEEVLDALENRASLVVLDNCEHLVAAVSGFASAVLVRSARVRILATSQEALGVRAEHLYRLETLAVPGDAVLPAARAYGAVTLFEDRVRAVSPQFVLDDSNIADVVAVCAALDGLPLAIELAAARVPLLGVSGIREHLHARFRLLTKGARVAERRHQTLRAALDWSYGLLSADERTVFRRIGVFSDGFTLAAAQDLCVSDGVDPWDVLDQLGALADKSLVVVNDAEPRRYRLLESAREYAVDKLAEAGEYSDVRDRHAALFVRDAAAAEPQLTSARRQPALKQLRTELSNLRAALTWLVHERKDAASALALAGSLAWFAYFEGLFQEWRRWLADALALAGVENHPRERATALSGAARLAAYAGEPSKARPIAQESMRLWREVGDVRGLAYALFHHAVACAMSSQWDDAKAALNESLASFRSLNDEWGIALCASYLGTSYAIVPGDEARARPLLLEGRARFRALGDEWGASVSSHYLGSIAMRTRDYTTARELTREMLVASRALGDKYRISRNLHQLAEIDVAEEKFESALRLLEESLTLTCQQGRAGDAALQFRLLASIASGLGDAEGAVTVAGVAHRHAGADLSMPADDPAVHAELLSTLRGRLGTERFDHKFAAGLALSLEQACAFASSLEPRSGQRSTSPLRNASPHE